MTGSKTDFWGHFSSGLQELYKTHEDTDAISVHIFVPVNVSDGAGGTKTEWQKAIYFDMNRAQFNSQMWDTMDPADFPDALIGFHSDMALK